MTRSFRPLFATITACDASGNVTRYAFDRLVEERWQASASAAVSHTIKRFYDAADQLLGVTETDTVNPASTTAWQFTYDASGNVVESRMAPGELVQQPISWTGSLAAGDTTFDWDGDGQGERAALIPAVSVLPGDVVDVVITATAFTRSLLLFRDSAPGSVVWYEAGAGTLTASRTADVADTWTFGVTSRAETATGGYEFRIVKNGNVFMPTALVEYDFTYDKAGNLLSATEDQAAVAQFGTLGPAASGLGVRTSYTLDALNRVTRTEQAVAATGVVTKRADYAYRGDGLVGSVTRFAGAGASPIGTSTAVYDGLGRITGITHTPTASASIAYGYTYDTASRIKTMTTPEGTSSFTLDGADQLLSASLTGEAYAYDNTGNRTSGGTQTGSGNRLAFDGTYRYAYDAEGNRTAKFLDTNAGGTLSLGDTDVTLYGYDQRNRLVAVSHVNAWTSTQATAMGAFGAAGAAIPGSDLELRYTYDYADRRIRRMIDADGQAGSGQESVSFAGYAGDVRMLEIARTATVTGGFLGQVVQRNFYGNGVDEILAVDRITWNGTTPTTSSFWTLSDHQDSVRDIVSGTGATLGQVVEHRQYDSFGKIVRRTTGPQAGAPATAGVGIDFGYAGRPLEARTGLSDNRARWYEPGTGKFINEDPSGFKGGDANLFRYVGNDPLNQVDPSGLAAKWASYAGKSSMPAGGWGALAQQNATLPKAASPSVSAMAYASLIRQPTQVAAVPMFSMPVLATTVSGAGFAKVTLAANDRSTAVQATLASPYQRVYRTEVERVPTPPSGVRPVSIGWNDGTRDARAWTDAAGNRWNTSVGEISAYGPPPAPPTWGQFAEAVSGIAVAIAGRSTGPRTSAAAAAKTGNRPPSMSPVGAGRQGALNEAKRLNGIPTSQQPSRTLPNTDLRGNPQPGRIYEYELPTAGGGLRTVQIRDDATGHLYPDNQTQNRGPHFNDEAGRHYDYPR